MATKKGTRGEGQGQKGSGTYTGARKLGKEDITDNVVKRGGGASRGVGGGLGTRRGGNK